jgi:ankyrin repeat protein
MPAPHGAFPIRTLPAHPNLEQYKKQAKELVRDCAAKVPEALERVRRYHPAFKEADNNRVALTDAQLVIAREHGYESWPKFAAQIRKLNLELALAEMDDPVAAFLRAACVPREGSHSVGSIEEAELIIGRYPHVARANVYTAAVRADEAGVRTFLAREPQSAAAKGGPYEWDALTYLCFSRYLRLDKSRSDAFVQTARALLEAGASANTGWYEMIDHPNPRPVLESAIYGAAGIAHHAELTRLLLEFGADPNDEETPYHAAEEYDLAALKALLQSGRLNQTSMTTLLLRKGDWHDLHGLQMLLDHGADPNQMTIWGETALHQVLKRDNRIENVAAMLDHGANPALKNRNGRSAIAIAAHRGRGDVLRLLRERGIDWQLEGPDRLIAACASSDDRAIRDLTAGNPALVSLVLAQGGQLLAEFAGNGNTEGVRRLLDLGVPANALFSKGDAYWDLAGDSTALHSAAWRGWPSTVKLLIERGAHVNARDGNGRTALILAVKACVDSYWKWRRTPESVDALLKAGASLEGVLIPCGYEEVDQLLRAAGGQT